MFGMRNLRSNFKCLSLTCVWVAIVSLCALYTVNNTFTPKYVADKTALRLEIRDTITGVSSPSETTLRVASTDYNNTSSVEIQEVKTHLSTTNFKPPTTSSTPKPSDTTRALPSVTAVRAASTEYTVSSVKLQEVKNHLNVTHFKEPPKFPSFHVGKYLFLDKDLCHDVPAIDLIVFVHTAPQHFFERNRIRSSFGNATLYLPAQIRVAFLLGKPKEAPLHQQLVSENARYGDTVMADFYDDYHNLTLKGLMGFRWVSERCANAKLVLKIDDDLVVNVYEILNTLSNFTDGGGEKTVYCNRWPAHHMLIERKGRWKVPRSIFHGQKAFPIDYCSGFFVIMSTDLMKPLFEAAKKVPFFWIDDVYLFGLLPYVAGGKHVGLTYREQLFLRQQETFECLEKKSCKVLGSLIYRDDYDKMWNIIHQRFSGNYTRRHVEMTPNHSLIRT